MKTSMACRGYLSGRVPLLFAVLGAWLVSACVIIADTTNSWRVFRQLDWSSVVTGGNRVGNPGMETPGVNPALAAWSPYELGYTASTNTAHGGTRSLQCTAANATEVHGGYQALVLNQATPKAIRLSGWSKAQSVTGNVDSDYSVYLDIFYTDGTPLYGQTISFSTGTHDWEYKEAVVFPAKPIRELYCYVLFRNTHTGTVWFDDITVSEILDPVTQFDGGPVVYAQPTPIPFQTTNRFTLISGAGLRLEVSQDGGVLEGLADGTNDLQAAGADFSSGWFICDRRARSDWWSVGGWVTNSNGILQQHGVVTGLNLSANIRYSVTNNAIRVQATVSNLLSSDRAVSLYFAVPAAMDGGFWWNSPRERVPLSQADESATLIDAAFGARNLVSQYPLATVSRLAAGNSGNALSLAIPADQYRPFRLAYNRTTSQFYAVFDVGLSPVTTNFPQSATVEVWLYRSDPQWGMRSGLAGLYSRFPSTYSTSFTNQGIWIAFADLSPITNVSDFNVAYHEIGYSASQVKWDDSKKIPSFRYVSEPWSYWMNMPTSVPNSTYGSVYNYLLNQYGQGSVSATATLSSGIRDPGGLLEFFPAAAPWCPYGAAFYLNPSPFISVPPFTVTKFTQEWNATVRDVYNHPENGVLDGEYIDSFSGYGTMADYSTNHQRSSSFPLTYTRDNLALMTPLYFGTCEMARAIAKDVHALGKPIIANSVFAWPYLPLGIGLFDFAGCEINWFDAAGAFIPPDDGALLYARSLSGQRPYGYLLNTDFSKVSQAEMELYMRVCAFYGIYPSAFSANAATGNYFEQPALYERDRPLFKKYVPLIRALSLAGWQPVSDASTDSASVGLETYGTNSFSATRYFTLRNFSSQVVSTTVSFDLSKWANPTGQSLFLTNLFSGSTYSINAGAGSNSVKLTVPAYDCQAYAVRASPPTRPMILMNEPSFGFNSNQFGFETGGALPGQVVVVEAATDLVNWTPILTNVTPANGRAYFIDPAAGELAHRFYRARFQ